MPKFDGADVKAGMRMAAEDINAVSDDLTRIAKESRFNILKGDKRKEFIKGITADEMDVLNRIAMAQGPEGLTALERIMNEAVELFDEEGDNGS